METQLPMQSQPEKKNNTPIIIAAVVIVLCCCFIIAAVAGFYAYNRTKSGQQFQVLPTDSSTPIPPELNQTGTETPSLDSGIGEAPTGGLGNDILRHDTWNLVAPTAAGLGCDKPIGKDTTIDVIEQPDANGRWVEHWNVACQSGEQYTFEIEFILDATGATFNLKYLP